MVAVMPGVRQKTKKPCKQAEEEARWKEAFKEFNRANDKKSWDLKRTGALFPQQEDGNNCGMFMMMAMFCICKGKNPTDCIWSLGVKEHRMAVACSVTENNLGAFKFDDLKEEKLQAMIPGTITDEKGTEKLQAMIPGTITSTITDKRHKNMGNQMFSRF